MFATNPTNYHLRNRRTLRRKYLEQREPLHGYQGYGNKDQATTILDVTTAAAAAVSTPTSPSGGSGNASLNPSVNSAGNIANTGGGSQAAPPANPPPAAQTTVSTGVFPTAYSGASNPPSGTDNPDVNASAKVTATPGSSTVGAAGAPVKAVGQLPAQGVAQTMHSTTSVGSLILPTVISSSDPNSNDNSNNASNTTNSNIDTSAHHSGSKSAIIAFATILSVLFLFFALLLLHRRFIVRRAERRQQWWFTRSVTHEDGNRDSWSQASLHDTPNSETLSVRSSFATTFDQSSPGFNVSFEGALPPLPPMAEIRRESGSLLFRENATAYSGTLYPSSEPSTSIENSSSSHQNSVHDATPDLSFQYFVSPPEPVANSNADGVRGEIALDPFSGSESFISPTLPEEQLIEVNSMQSRPQSMATPKSPAPSSGKSRTLTPKLPPKPLILKHTSGIPNPFADPSTSPGPSQLQFETLETIRRPFTPFRNDQLHVDAGDRVRVLDMYSDGWAMAEIMTTSGKRRGLVPIDCLRKPGQDLPISAAAKKISSYAAYEGATAI